MTRTDGLMPLPLNQGGLYRCCIDSYETQAPPAVETEEGQVMVCPACTSVLEVRDGEWRWQVPIS